MELNEEQLNNLIKEFGIEVVNPERNYWLIRAGKEGVFFEDFLFGNFTGIGYGLNNIENINDLKKEEIKEKIEQFYPNVSQSGHIAAKIFNFFHNIKKGDVIVMPAAGRKSVAFGIVKEDNIYFDKSLPMEQSMLFIEDEDYDIPNKRRKVSWKKTVNSKFLQSKLILNLFSPHGLSQLTDPDVIKLIDINMNDFFIKEDTGFLTFQINHEKSIDLKTLTNFMGVLEELASQTDGTPLSVQMNLNSPGKLTVYGTKIAVVSLVVFAGIITVFGGHFKSKDGNEISSEGAMGFVKEYFKHKENLEETKIKYLDAINKLDIDEAEKIKLIRETMAK